MTPLDPKDWSKQAAGFVKDILSGLDHMHQRRILHKDIKVQNIFMEYYKKIICIRCISVRAYENVNQNASERLLKACDHTATDMQKLFIHRYPPLSVARHWFIQLSELEQCRVKTLAQGLTVRQPWIQN